MWGVPPVETAAEISRLIGPELQTNAVDAMAGPRFSGPIRKDVAEVRITCCAPNFYPNHAVAVVVDSGDLVGRYLSVKAGPTAPRIEFGCAGIQCRIADLTVVGALPGFCV